MTDLPAFLRSILESQPHDTAVRLVFADYLHEIGQGERGEFIQLEALDLKCECRWGWIGASGDNYEQAQRCPVCRQKIDRHHRLKELRALPLGPLPRPTSAPQLADILRRWAGPWPHEDDSLRPLLVWWLGAVEWDFERAGKVQETKLDSELFARLMAQDESIADVGRRAMIAGEEILFERLYNDRGEIIRYNSKHPAVQAAMNRVKPIVIRNLKRRVLALFPEVEWTEVFEWSFADASKRVESAIRNDRPLQRVADGEKRCIRYTQTLRAPDWIAPERDVILTTDEERQVTGVSGLPYREPPLATDRF